jgi:NADPH2:quinone reductase
VLTIGELAMPEPAAGEVRVRLRYSGINPGDTKKRRGWLGSTMPYARVVPHSDGAGVVDAVGDGVERARVGHRVWVHGAQSYRPFGTAAEYTVVPSRLAIDLPDNVSDEVGASLGIPGITAHRAVFGDGPVADQTIVVQGVLGGVGRLAAQLASWAGAAVIGTVRATGDLDDVPAGLDRAFALDDPGTADAITRQVGAVDRIIEVAFSDNIDFDTSIIKNGGVIAAYATRDERPSLPFWPMLFDNVTIRLLGSDDFPAEAKAQAARDLTEAAATSALAIPIGEPFRLDQIAAAHERVEAGSRDRVLLITSP